MCLILFAVNRHPHYPLVVAANRDEFHQRPTAAMHWWPQEQVLAGKDLLSGGTWLAITASGDISAVTNVREGSQALGQRSRGALPLLALEEDPASLTDFLHRHQDRFAGFNLIRLNGHHGWYYSNRDAHPGRHLHRGLYGLSNHLLQSPWPKLLRLRTALGETLDQHSRQPQPERLHQQLLALLQDETPAPDRHLPQTGVALETERFLSTPFIRGDAYGTRASTIMTLSRTGEIRVTEQSWGPNGRDDGQLGFQWQQATDRATG